VSPELSVVIVSYRCAAHLAACLDSLESTGDDVDLEVIVLDNASGDHTPRVAEGRPRTAVVRRHSNDGFARAANEGMERARGRAVLVLNPDTAVPPGALRACLNALWADPRIGVLTPRVLDSRGHLDPRCHRRFPTAWSAFCFATGLDRHLPARIAGGYVMRDLPEHLPADVDAVSGAFMLMTNNALHQVGGFDQQFFMYAEDIDLCMRFRRAGYLVRYWPGAHVVHAGGGSHEGGERTGRADAAAYRTMAPLIAKHRHGLRGGLLVLTAWIAGELLLAVRRLRRRAT